MTVRLAATKGYTSLSPIDKGFICNGAGAAGDWRSKLIPNTLYFMDCTEVFNIHDHAYSEGKTLGDKNRADREMLINLFVFINTGSWFLGYFRRRRALKYYEAVNCMGEHAFFANKAVKNFSKKLTVSLEYFDFNQDEKAA